MVSTAIYLSVKTGAHTLVCSTVLSRDYHKSALLAGTTSLINAAAAVVSGILSMRNISGTWDSPETLKAQVKDALKTLKLRNGTHQKPGFNCLEHMTLQVHPNNSLIAERQAIAHGHSLPQPVVPAHGVLLKGVKLPFVHWQHPM